jgi:hypothetical protein
MGLFDLPSPLLTFLNDHLLAWSPLWLQLTFWSMAAAWLSMSVFKRLSRQETIAELKKLVKSNQNQMARFDGEFTELTPLIGNTLKLAVRQFGLAVVPASLASIPVIFLLVWLSNHFGYQSPQAGDFVSMQVISENPVNIQLDPIDGGEFSGAGQWRLSWPDPGEVLVITEHHMQLVQLPLASPIPVIHKWQWWNWLIGNPLGHLPHDSQMDALKFELPGQQVLNFGPSWMQGWVFTFFTGFLVFSAILKFTLKIE